MDGKPLKIQQNNIM